MVTPSYFGLLGVLRGTFGIFPFYLCDVFHAWRDGRLPKQIADQMVFADVVAEEIDALMLLARVGVVRRCGCSGGQRVQV